MPTKDKEEVSAASITFWIEITAARVAHSHGKTHGLGKMLWSPTYSRGGADIYSNMRRVKKGDVVFHFTDRKFLRGASIVAKDCTTSTFAPDDTPWSWSSNFYNIKLKDFLELDDDHAHRDLYLTNRSGLDVESVLMEERWGKVFYTKDLQLRQGAYLTELPLEIVAIWNQVYKARSNKDLPHLTTNIIKVLKNKSKLTESAKKLIATFKKAEPDPKNLILYGPPGTGKTHEIQTGYIPQYSAETDRYVFVTFHQSYAYEDFVEGIRPVMNKNQSGAIAYEIAKGPFLEIAEKASQDPDNRYAIFIDEINRGNISKIFGELITLIEVNKRQGSENQASATLIYSKQEFSVPKNLDIIGTMNTADRSIALLDSALRRRFDFEEIRPQSDLIDGSDGNGNIEEDINLRLLLDTINTRLTSLLGRDQAIGHAYFMTVRTLEDLESVLKRKIIPLLAEYFYDDWRKIQLIFGDVIDEDYTPHTDQIIEENRETSTDVFGIDLEEYEEISEYSIADTLSPESIKKIYWF